MPTHKMTFLGGPLDGMTQTLDEAPVKHTLAHQIQRQRALDALEEFHVRGKGMQYERITNVVVYEAFGPFCSDSEPGLRRWVGIIAAMNQNDELDEQRARTGLRR